MRFGSTTPRAMVGSVHVSGVGPSVTGRAKPGGVTPSVTMQMSQCRSKTPLASSRVLTAPVPEEAAPKAASKPRTSAEPATAPEVQGTVSSKLTPRAGEHGPAPSFGVSEEVAINLEPAASELIDTQPCRKEENESNELDHLCPSRSVGVFPESDLRTQQASSSALTATCESHASEWAIFRSMSRDHEGLASTEEVQKMCQNLGGSEHSEVVVRLMDPLKSGRVSFEEFVKHSDIVLAIQRSCRLRQWHRCFGLGVVWNALQVRQGHAGEDVGGVTLCNRPDSVYTFYSPRAAAHQDETRRSRSLQCGIPIGSPQSEDRPQHMQVELGLVVDVVYTDDSSSVLHLIPRQAVVMMDSSCIESSQEGDVGSWSGKAKSLRALRLDSVAEGTLVDRLVLVSYVFRGGEILPNTMEYPVRNYPVFHQALLEWSVHEINRTSAGVLAPIFPELVASDFPTSMCIAVGPAPSSSPGPLQRADECLAVLYDEQQYPDGLGSGLVRDLFSDLGGRPGLVALRQTLV